MPGPFHGYLLIKDRMGRAYELLNNARTAAYLSNPDLSIPYIDLCSIEENAGCDTYAMMPNCGPVDNGGRIVFPGTAGNAVTTPDATSLDSLGDTTIVVHVAFDNWAAPGSQYLVTKAIAPGQQSYWFAYQSSGALSWSWTSDGINATGANSVATSLSALPGGTWRYLAVTFDANVGGTDKTFWWWTSYNGVDWTLYSTATSGGVTTIFNSTTPLTIGAWGDGISFPFDGAIDYVAVYKSIGPGGLPPTTTPDFVFDERDLEGINANATTFTATSGHVMTVNHSGSPSTTIVPYTGPFDTAWSTLSFYSPETDPAPWYNANYPQSADALGFMVEEWTGLDDAHIKRTVTTYSNGAQLGPLGTSGRVMKINVFLFGRTEEATEYLFRWLAATLTGVCSDCASDSILIRRFCGEVEDPWNGIAEMRRVGLIEGLKWESDPVALGDGSCFFRRASFALQAGDPCMYLPETEVEPILGDVTATLATCLTQVPTDSEREFCRPNCAELRLGPCRDSFTFEVSPMASMGPVVTWTNSMNQHAYPFRAVLYFDPNQVGVDLNNPCGLQIIGEIYVRALPPSSSLRWDVTGRSVEFLDPSTGGFSSGWSFVDANDQGYQKFFSLPCGRHHLVLEPASVCAELVSGTTYTLGGLTFAPPTFPTTQIWLSERIGCP